MSSLPCKTTNLLPRFHQRVTVKSNDGNAPAVLIAALGDSVTAGVTTDDEYLHDAVYHAQLKRLLEARYPRCLFNVLNAGQNGQDATGGMANLRRDVLHHQPDLLLIGFGLNDAAQGDFEGVETFARGLQALIQVARAETPADIILLTPNMMPHHDNEKIPERWRHVTEKFTHLQNDGVLAAYAQCVRDVGVEQSVTVADVYGAWEALATRGVDTTAMLANGLNHPDATGHRLAAEVLMDTITKNEIRDESAIGA